MDRQQLLAQRRIYISAHLFVNIVLTAIATFFTVWISYAAPQTTFTDPGWLLNLPAIILQFNADSFRLIGIIILAIAFCRQGSLLVRGKIGYVVISKLIQSGIFTFIILLVIRKFLEVTGHRFDDGLTVLFLIVLYLCLSLATHALARVGVVRRHYSVGKKNDLIRQERVTLQAVILASSLLLAIALGTGAILNATIIGDTGVLYFKANSYFIPPLGSAKKPVPCGKRCAGATAPPKEATLHVSLQPLDTLLAIILLVLFFILLVAVAVLACLLVIRLFRWRRRRERPRQRWELRESLWSWHLFWQQVKNIMYALLKRVMALTMRSPQMTHASFVWNSQKASLSTIYDIYLALLQHAANQGYPRANYETPHEFSNRLAQHFPLLALHFSLITSAYVVTRYAGTVLKPEDASAAQYAWGAVQQSWQAQENW